MNEDKTPTTAAEVRALAEEAEAEAAEAEALAAAARARARAIQLRRKAELIEAKKEDAKQGTSKQAAAEEDEVADSVPTGELHDTPEIGSEEIGPAIQSESVESGEGPGRDVAEAEGDTSSADGGKPARRRRLLRRLRGLKRSSVAASIAVVLILAALSGSGYMVSEHRDAVRKRQHAAEFTAAARQGVVTLTSLDFKNAKQGVQRILDNSTGTFKDDFAKSADDFTKVVEESKVVAQGTIQAAGVELGTMTDDSAVVLVAATAEVTNAAGAKQEPRSYRLIVTVTRDGGQLKIAKVEFVP